MNWKQILSQFAVYERNNEIGVANYGQGNGMVDQDIIIILRNNSEIICRKYGKEKIIGEFPQEKYCFTAFYCYVKKTFISNYDLEHQDDFMNLPSNDIIGLDNLMQKYQPKYYAIENPTENCMNLEEIDTNGYNVYYLSNNNEKNIISKKRTSPTVFAVFYNYTRNLASMNKYIDDFSEKFGYPLTQGEKSEIITLLLKQE